MNENALTRDRDIKKETGVSPALAGAAVYQGLPMVTRHLSRDIPNGLTNLLSNGKPISTPGGFPLGWIAEFSRKEVDIIRSFAKEQNVKIPIVASLLENMKGERASYFADQDFISDKISDAVRRMMGKKPVPKGIAHIGLGSTSLPTAFHEIGHASPVGKSHLARKILQESGGLLSQGLPGNLVRGGIAAQVLSPIDEDSSTARRFAYNHAPALVGATFLPELAEEARATTKAVRGARRHGIGIGTTLKELLPAISTYAAPAIASVVATMLAKKVVEALHARTEEKTAGIKAPGILRTGASSAWHIGGKTPPKPKSIKPNTGDLGGSAKTRAPAKPPSNKAYHKDMLASLYNPGRGSRLSVGS